MSIDAKRGPDLKVGDVVRSARGDFRVTHLDGAVVYGNRRKGGEWSKSAHEVRGYWVQVERAKGGGDA